MNVKMTGIDHGIAGVDVRQCFAFTRKAMAEAMETIKQYPGVKGCVMLSTCNRMELWVSMQEQGEIDLPELVCSLKQLPVNEYGKFLQVREGKDAIRHLFFLSAGLKSQILGEDQILTQVKEALSFAREQESTDHTLEVLFRMAVTAGKQVKTEVPIDKSNSSAAHQAIHFLKEKGMKVRDRKVLVIGNGEMGKITASLLMEEGADVMVTVRQYKSGVVNIPKGAKRMNYGERYTYLPECDFVFSATASPNFTITRAGLEGCSLQKPQIYVDLAVPRDMEAEIQKLEQVTLYDIDSFGADEKSAGMKEQFQQAEVILTEHIRHFWDWQENREIIPRIQKIGADSAQEFCWRMKKSFIGNKLNQEDKENLQEQMEQTAEKVVNKLMFALRDELDTDTLRQCVEVLEKVYGENKE